MDLVQTLRKEGTSRGGRGEFKWEDVKADSQRENYLGHSLMAPVGRWQKGRDLNWYAKGDSEEKQSAADKIAEEKRKLKEAEEDAMLRAMGLPVPDRASNNANLTPLGKGPEGEQKTDEKAENDQDGVRESKEMGRSSRRRERSRDRKEHSRRAPGPRDDARRRRRSRSGSRDRRDKRRDRSRSEERRPGSGTQKDYGRRRISSRSRERERRSRVERRDRHRERRPDDERSRSRSRDRHRHRHQRRRSRSPYDRYDRRRD